MNTRKLLPAAALLLLLASCSTPKEIAYFQDLSSVEGQRIAAAKEIIVRPKDKISIIVNCKSPELTALFNLPYVTQRLGENTRSTITSGYSRATSLVTRWTTGAASTSLSSARWPWRG